MITLIILSVLAFLSCKKTPQNVVVVNKSNGIEIAESEETRYDTQNLVDTKWCEQINLNENVTLNADTKIDIPSTNKYQVIQVKPSLFSQETIDEYINYFAKGKKLFEWPAQETKEELENQLIHYKRGMEVDGEFIPPSDDDPYILELMEKINNAPIKNTRKYIDSIEIPYDSNGSQVTAGIEINNNQDAVIITQNYGDDNYNSSFSYDIGGNMINESIAKLNNITINDPNISETDALKVAEKLLTELQIENMILSKVVKSQIKKIDDYYGMKAYYESSGYQMFFVPIINGLKVVDTSDNGTYSKYTSKSTNYLPEYSAPWCQEMITIYVDENGVQKFFWNGYTQIDKVLDDNVKLLDFPEMKDRISKQAYYKNAENLKLFNSMQLNINRIELGLSLINKKDERAVALLVPAWYTFLDIEKKTDTESYYENDTLVISAIDGSIIDTFPARYCIK